MFRGTEEEDRRMIKVGQGRAETCARATRRDFLRVGGLSLGSWGLHSSDRGVLAGGPGEPERSVILLLLVGGPSQLETWDPKPDAPREVRGPFASIPTRCPGVRICEHLPRLAARMDRLALIRSVYHDAAPLHETGFQLLQTGRLCQSGQEHPHAGSVVACLSRSRSGLPPFVILPGPIQSTGVEISHGQSAGWLGPDYEPFRVNADPAAPDFDPRRTLDRRRARRDQAGLRRNAGALELAPSAEPFLNQSTCRAFDLSTEPDSVRRSYGPTTFGQSCLLARRLVECGVRLVTVNMFETVFHRVTWDCHGLAPFSTLHDYERELLPLFDQAFSALLDDLAQRGRLDSTLVVAAGEFGRTPRINAAGGRDHWPGVWSIALAGGGVQGGQVIGSSDPHAGSPADRPVTLPNLLATIYHSLGIAQSQTLSARHGLAFRLIGDADPIRELFA
jgi:Protein of unknown function (DUF1501)